MGCPLFRSFPAFWIIKLLKNRFFVACKGKRNCCDSQKIIPGVFLILVVIMQALYTTYSEHITVYGVKPLKYGSLHREFDVYPI